MSHDSIIELPLLRTASYLCTELCNDHSVLFPQLYRKCCSYLLEAYGCCGVSPLSQGNLRWTYCLADLSPRPQLMVAVETVLLGILSLVTGRSSLDVLPC